MIRVWANIAAALILMAASPAEEARQLMEKGKEAEAFTLIEPAAQGDDAEAINYLAWFYDTGRFVDQNLKQAAMHYRRAADLGNSYSQWRLGVMMDTGECSCGDPAQAVLLFEKAAAQSSTNALVSLGVMQSTGRGTTQDYAKAKANFEKAARLGNMHGLNELAVMHFAGEGVPTDPQEALAWFIVAATYGNERAASVLQNSYQAIDIDMIEAVARANEIIREYGLPEEIVPPAEGQAN